MISTIAYIVVWALFVTCVGLIFTVACKRDQITDNERCGAPEGDMAWRDWL